MKRIEFDAKVMYLTTAPGNQNFFTIQGNDEDNEGVICLHEGHGKKLGDYVHVTLSPADEKEPDYKKMWEEWEPWFKQRMKKAKSDPYALKWGHMILKGLELKMCEIIEKHTPKPEGKDEEKTD